MPRTKEKDRQPPKTNQSHRPLSLPGDVLTLAEAASYLRLPETEITRLVHAQDLPGRFTGTEWRFLRAALQQWLSTPPPRHSKEAQLSVAGSWKDDPYVDEKLKEIYRQRGRPMTEDEA